MCRMGHGKAFGWITPSLFPRSCFWVHGELCSASGTSAAQPGGWGQAAAVPEGLPVLLPHSEPVISCY